MEGVARTRVYWQLDDGLSVGPASTDEGVGTADTSQQNKKTTTQKMAPRHLAWLFLNDPEQLEKREQRTLSLLRRNKTIDHAYELAQQFVMMVKERNVGPIDTWLLDCQESDVSALVTFAQGLKKEGSALHAALTLPYSNGPVEGKINKLKSIKRSMYGRSGFPLLRQKVLKAA
jgi:transposase